MKSIVILASTKREAKEIGLREYGKDLNYLKPYKYASKGNNFYEFNLPEECYGFPIQDDIWPSRRWNKEMTQHIDLSGK